MRMGSLYAVTSCCVGFNVSIHNDTKSHTNLSIVINKSQSQSHCYHPQRSCGKVIFSQASVILSTGGCLPAIPWADTPLAGRQHRPLKRRLLQRTVRILLECNSCVNISSDFRTFFAGRKLMCLMHFCGVSYNNQLQWLKLSVN